MVRVCRFSLRTNESCVRCYDSSNSSPAHRGGLAGVLRTSGVIGEPRPPMGSVSGRRFGEMDSRHEYSVVTDGVRSSRTPTPGRFQLDISQPTEGSSVSSLCHRRTPHGHPLRGRLVDELYGPHHQVHRLHDAALPGSPDVLRIPHQGPLTLGWCGTNRDAFGGTLGHSVLAFILC